MTAQRPATTPRAAQWRKLIHVAKRELRLDEETYRTILRTVGGAESTSAMNMPHLAKVLDHLKRAGFKVRPSKQPGSRPIYIDSADAQKVRALWLFLHTLGVVQDPSETALAAYVKRIAKVDDLRWVRADDYTRLIESLKRWAMRFLPGIVSAMVDELASRDDLTPAQSKHAVAAVRRLADGNGFDIHWQAWVHCMRALGRAIPPEVAPQQSKRSNGQ